MVIYGGFVPGSTYLDTAWTLNLTSYVWNKLTIDGPKPSGRYGHSSILYNGAMVMFGGQAAGSYNYLNDAWALNLTSNLTHYTWNELNASVTKPSSRVHHSSILHNGKMVMFGGNNFGSKNDAWFFLQEPTTTHAPTTTTQEPTTATQTPMTTTTTTATQTPMTTTTTTRTQTPMTTTTTTTPMTTTTTTARISNNITKFASTTIATEFELETSAATMAARFHCVFILLTIHIHHHIT